ncbi:MAG: hypothetical protein P8Z68_00860 [Kineosporiaceae bacterium]|jgi:hypothetical protein
MQEDEARQVIDGLRTRGVIARLTHAGPFRVGIRVPLGDGREALWDVDGAAGLEAQVMRNGVLVGFIPAIPGSEDYDEQQTIQAIAEADYGRG